MQNHSFKEFNFTKLWFYYDNDPYKLLTHADIEACEPVLNMLSALGSPHQANRSKAFRDYLAPFLG